jgi:hypothetical protein
MSEALAARSHLGVTVRHHPHDVDKILEARRALAAAKIADFIQRTVATAPPLTAEQRDRLAGLFRVAS